MTAPYCAIEDELTSIAALAATTTSVPADVTEPLRLIYMKDIPHQKIIVSEIIADLHTNGISVLPIPLEKGAYNDAMNTWTGDDGDAYTEPGSGIHPGGLVSADGSYISFDLALSET